MQTVVSSLTTIALVLHMLVGCCLHHGHACALARADQQCAACPADEHLHGHEHSCGQHEHSDDAPSEPTNHSSENPAESQEPIPHEGCDDSPCVTVVGSKTLPTVDLDPSYAPVALRRAACDDAVAIIRRHDQGLLRDRGAPLRLHLLLQILLV